MTTAVPAAVLTAVHSTVQMVPDAPAAIAISPGTVGFLVTFALVIATALLIRSMVGHLRTVRYGPSPVEAGPDGRDGVGESGPGDPARE